jgi:hypothetical protein
MKHIVIMSLLLLGLGLSPVGSLSAFAQGIDQTKQVDGGPPPSATPTGCASECKTCASECEKTLAYCLKQGGKHKESKHIQALKDCIATCKISQDFMSRGSDLSSQTCAVCAEACKRCAESCATFKDKAMQQCADECKKCEESCASMSK